MGGGGVGVRCLQRASSHSKSTTPWQNAKFRKPPSSAETTEVARAYLTRSCQTNPPHAPVHWSQHRDACFNCSQMYGAVPETTDAVPSRLYLRDMGQYAECLQAATGRFAFG